LAPYYKNLAMHGTSAKNLLLSVIEILASKKKFGQLKINSLMDRFYYKSWLIFEKDFFSQKFWIRETIDTKEYIDCSLAWPACLVLVE
jgi:hypothetical protein